MDRANGVGRAQFRAAADQFLATTLHLRVVALNGRKIEFSLVAARIHRGRVSTAQTDQHGRTADLNHRIAGARRQFFDLLGIDEARTTCDHDGLVVAAVALIDNLFEGAKDTQQIGSAEFVAESGATDGSFHHDVEGGCQPRRMVGDLRLPRQRHFRQPQMRDVEGAQSRLGMRATARGSLVPDLSADAGGRTRKRGDRRRVVVRLHLTDDVSGPRRVSIPEAVAIRAKHLGFVAFDHT